jgi:hypothetical protein
MGRRSVAALLGRPDAVTTGQGERFEAYVRRASDALQAGPGADPDATQIVIGYRQERMAMIDIDASDRRFALGRVRPNDVAPDAIRALAGDRGAWNSPKDVVTFAPTPVSIGVEEGSRKIFAMMIAKDDGAMWHPVLAIAQGRRGRKVVFKRR